MKRDLYLFVKKIKADLEGSYLDMVHPSRNMRNKFSLVVTNYPFNYPNKTKRWKEESNINVKYISTFAFYSYDKIFVLTFAPTTSWKPKFLLLTNKNFTSSLLVVKICPCIWICMEEIKEISNHNCRST